MLKIGWATRDLTPTRPAMLMGQMYPRVARAALDPITVTAWAVEDVVFVSCDLCFVSDDNRQDVLALLPAEIPAGNVILSATHTHESLVLIDGWYPHPGGDVMTLVECRDWAAERIAGAIVEAWRARQPRRVSRAFGHAVVGHNRYAVYADGAGAMYGKTNRPDFRAFGGYEDHSVDMFFTWEPDGKLAGVALAIPCPSQVDEHAKEFSADYWHEVRVELRRRFGQQLQVLAWCAPAGDQSPHLLIYQRAEEEMRRRRGISERQEIAQRVGDAVARALACTPPGDDTPVFRHVVRELRLTPFQVSAKDAVWAQARYDEYVAAGDKNSQDKSNPASDPNAWWPRKLQEVIATAKGLSKPEPVWTQIHVVRLGEAVFATSPFELFLDYSMRIKARSPAAQTILAQLTAGGGGAAGYLASERGVQAGSYGAVPSSCAVGPEGGRELVEVTLAAIGDLFAP